MATSILQVLFWFVGACPDEVLRYLQRDFRSREVQSHLRSEGGHLRAEPGNVVVALNLNFGKTQSHIFLFSGRFDTDYCFANEKG